MDKKKQPLVVSGLRHGGIMANYKCNAACRHCLYACSPDRDGGYIAAETTREVCGLLRKAGCYSVHIGGGEPFLDFDGLITLIKIVSESGITVEYIETNAFWATDYERVRHQLRELYNAGADTLCISIDPFHAEHVPFGLPLSLAKMCRDAGFRFFLWQERYLAALSKAKPDKIHSRKDLEKYISKKYILETAKSYGLSFGGRAINIEAEYGVKKSTDSIAVDKPCLGLLTGGHFHVDLNGRFIPPGCTGIAISLKETVNGIPKGKYPVLEELYYGGSAGLLRYARALGFEADQGGYPSSCALCFRIRHWLSKHAPTPELDAEHYTESLRFYG
jgi:hypothetical protein